MEPGRENEVVVEVVRAGMVVGTIYGSREGVHIISECFRPDDGNGTIVGFEIEGGAPGLMVVMLRPGEACPWCGGAGQIAGGSCPICG